MFQIEITEEEKNVFFRMKKPDKNQSLNLLFTTSTDYGKCSTEIQEF